MNPILPSKFYIPDGEAHTWADGRLYLYGSKDIQGDRAYCSCEYNVFSTKDMVEFVDHGTSFKAGDTRQLYAPDCAYKDGTYYMYYCTAGAGEGVATSDKPYGPFENEVSIPVADGDSIDPAVFVDDDGQAYYFWGQFHLRGGRLKPNMRELDESTIQTDLIDEVHFGFHEGSSMRKRNGIYYLVYTDISRGRATCLGYAMATSPLGPFKKGGIIIDNTGCDPKSWNNHGSIEEINGQWYVFYHRSTNNSEFSRRACAEPITFNEDGTIKEVEQTTQGAEPPIDAVGIMGAWRACLVENCYMTAISYSEDDICDFVTGITNGSWVCYRYLDFSKQPTGFTATAASCAYGATIELRLDSPDGEKIGEVTFGRPGGWQCYETRRCDIKPVDGVHALYLTFSGLGNGNAQLLNLKEFSFTL